MSLAKKFKDEWAKVLSSRYDEHPMTFAEHELGLELVEHKVTGTWRWGTVESAVYRDPTTDDLIEVTFYDAGTAEQDLDAGDMRVEAYDVVPEYVIKIDYARV